MASCYLAQIWYPHHHQAKIAFLLARLLPGVAKVKPSPIKRSLFSKNFRFACRPMLICQAKYTYMYTAFSRHGRSQHWQREGWFRQARIRTSSLHNMDLLAEFSRLVEQYFWKRYIECFLLVTIVAIIKKYLWSNVFGVVPVLNKEVTANRCYHWSSFI